MNRWEQIHEKLCIAIQRLIAVCNEEIVAVLEKKFLFINRRWKEISDLVKQVSQDESIKKKRQEFFTASSSIVETLDKIDREIREYLPCTTKALKEQENRLYVSENRISLFENFE
jgi:hypothetical protein